MNIIESIDGLGIKVCSKCGVPKKLSDFSTRKRSESGRASECKVCHSARGKEYYEANKERIAELGKKRYEANKERVAERCKEWREANKGRIAERGKEWYEANKERKAERSKEWREANKERCAEQGKEWREANKERCVERSKEYRKANKERAKEYHEANKERRSKQLKEWYKANRECCAERKKEYYEANKERAAELGKKYRETNKERRAERNKEWHKANPDKARSYGARRRSIKLQAHPPWAATLEKRQIQEFYTLARMQSEATGKEYHVDHIHPLQAPKEVMFEGEMIPLICGLHVPANLQILEASVNCSKHNKFEPYIESECDFTELWQVRSNDRTLIPTPIDRIPRRYPRAFIKPRKSKGVPKGQLALF